MKLPKAKTFERAISPVKEGDENVEIEDEDGRSSRI